ncbi:hypothetical protein [Vibrio breoganii]|uniref:hypothetical protein n=1 Tax=Vibrio breoganii TaxID=553239 RepID=UPI000C82FB1B|nr:hypothetical protein [Vibrio breoganii]MDN3718038.1 hypothetical protein [Vibrio breoganii]PMG91771.1 hypothetical protein BCU80_01040 [Vibrio breoganii]PMK17207.1 hypothetical protein BCU06_10785 [Vibrio breoganii]PMK59379.1 hypothetical protein BCT98_06340 [Vibrio breoganii]PMK76088.1 hypothetical protein BCT94_07970 [Vibrio breoganii]
MSKVSLNTLSAIYNYVNLAKKLRATSGEVAVRDSQKLIENALELTDLGKDSRNNQENFESDTQLLLMFLEEELDKRKLRFDVLK